MEVMQVAIRIQLRRDTAANWTSSNPILRSGEVGIETDTLKLKIGNGTSTWTQLTQYVSDEKLNTSTAASTYAPLASPSLTGTPLSTTAAVDTNTTQIATTAYVVGQGYLKSATASSTYAPLASPSLTGTPTAPTATAGTNSTQIATTAFVGTAVANLVDSAPGTLDTLNELAAAINDNASFAATIATSLIPSQSGNAGKYLTTDGTTASWAPAATETPHPFAMIG
jgi:hypothetical protein